MLKSKKFNVIDLLVVLVIIIFVLGLGIRLLNSGTVKNTTEVTYTVEVKNVRKYTVDALKKSSVLTNEDADKVLGEIISVSERPYEVEAHFSDGTAEPTEMPERYTCTVVMKSPVKRANNRYFADEEVEISQGRSFNIITKYVKTNGKILEVDNNAAESGE